MAKLGLLLFLIVLTIGAIYVLLNQPTGGWNLYKTDAWEFYYPTDWRIKYQNVYGQGSGFELEDPRSIYTLGFMQYAKGDQELRDFIGKPERIRSSTVAGLEAIIAYETTAYWVSPDGKYIHVFSLTQNEPKFWRKMITEKLFRDILASFRYLNTSSKILFNLSDGFAFGQSWPAELAQLRDDNLLDLKCSEAGFESQESGVNFSYWCDAPNQSRIIVEEIHGESYKDINVSRIGNTSAGLVDIPNPGWAYFTCANPLALTRDGVFYVQCGGGEEGFAGSVIYKLNLGRQTVSKVLQCTSSNPAGWSTPKIECN